MKFLIIIFFDLFVIFCDFQMIKYLNEIYQKLVNES